MNCPTLNSHYCVHCRGGVPPHSRAVRPKGDCHIQGRDLLWEGGDRVERDGWPPGEKQVPRVDSTWWGAPPLLTVHPCIEVPFPSVPDCAYRIAKLHRDMETGPYHDERFRR
jgi:hypothetical protein